MELSWAAGFFDGEGCVTTNTSFDKANLDRLKLTVGQSGDEAPPALLRFHDAVGRLGHLRGPYGPYNNSKAHRHPVWQYNITGEAAHEAFALLRPYLLTPGPKVARYEELLSKLGGRA